MVSLIKQAAAEAIEERLPMTILFGIVLELQPELIVEVEQHFRLREEQLIFPADPRWSRPIAEGDMLLLHRIPGGEKYLIMGRM
jgi:hypothetical protein